MNHIAVIGGGAAGFFAALRCAERYPAATITLFEKTDKLLYKVRISGGGRCNVTHHCFEVAELCKNYPRGHRELRGPFSRFGPQHTVAWFAQQGVRLKTEADGRMFPVTDNSETIAGCFLQLAQQTGIHIRTRCGLQQLQPTATGWVVHTTSGQAYTADAVIVTTGSNHGIWHELTALGHTIVPPVPSLFTFHIQSPLLQGLAGISVPLATVSLQQPERITTSGPLLITHWGLSGPAVLKLSAWGARALAGVNYRCTIQVNWVGGLPYQTVLDELKERKQQHPRQQPLAQPLYHIPQRLWKSLLQPIAPQLRYADLSNAQLQHMAATLTQCSLPVNGKSTHKDEFVTAGGVDLKEVDFKTMQSKLHKGLFFAGEVLDIDAVTGGFNFQAAWTTAWIAGALGGPL